MVNSPLRTAVAVRSRTAEAGAKRRLRGSAASPAAAETVSTTTK